MILTARRGQHDYFACGDDRGDGDATLAECLPGLNARPRTPIACRSPLQTGHAPGSGTSGSTVRGICDAVRPRSLLERSFTGSEDFNTEVGDGLERET